MKSEQLVAEVAEILQRDLRRRFKKFTDPSSVDHNPLFIVATLLDPRYRLALNTVMQASAKKHLLEEHRIPRNFKSCTASVNLEWNSRFRMCLYACISMCMYVCM